MPRAVPVGPETRFDIDRETGHADDAPQHRDSAHFFGAFVRLVGYFAARPYEPPVPDAGEHSERYQLAPEERAKVEREFRAGGIQTRGKCELIIPEPEKYVCPHHQRASPEQGFPAHRPVAR